MSVDCDHQMHYAIHCVRVDGVYMFSEDGSDPQYCLIQT